MIRRERSSDAAFFWIEVEGIVDPHWQSRLGGLELSPAVGSRGSRTRLSGWLLDQAQLHGVLTAVRDLGLVLSLVRRFASDPGATNGHDGSREPQ